MKRTGGRFARRQAATLLVCAFVIPASLARGQEGADGDREQPRPPTIFDFIDHEVRDPHDLRPPARKFEDRWRRIWGSLGMRYHLYPSQAAGADDWPPRLYSGGFNYSIWRNPVTGWPDF